LANGSPNSSMLSFEPKQLGKLFVSSKDHFMSMYTLSHFWICLSDGCAKHSNFLSIHDAIAIFHLL